ncbi:glycerophosphoryl diester phosphodiesterase membrane domain-containing protein [Mycetocola sp.]|uniref:glycerophosphoryl diester phosphodiesterase membrane domain-containing protein n=1 Tax=Mycetocola sp. TaxID=1871042 RepID=UPI003989A139
MPQQPYGQLPYGQNPYSQQYAAPAPFYPQVPYVQNPYPPSGQAAAGYPGTFALAAWAPPPKPGLIPLRPLGFGTLLGAPFLTLKRNPKATFGSALLVQAITVLVSLLVVGVVTFFVISRITSAAPEDQDAVASGGILAIILSSLVPFLVGLAATVFLQGVIVTEAARSTLGEKLTLRATWKATWPRLGHLLLWTLLAGAAVAVVVALIIGVVWLLVALGGGFIAAGVVLAILAGLALLAAAVWLGIKLSIVPSVIVLERAGVVSAIRRSWQLTDGYFWRTLGVQYLIAFIVGTVSQVVVTPISLLYMLAISVIDPTSSTAEDWIAPALLYVGLIIVSLLVASVTSVVQSATVAFIYIDLRMRKEGLDLELIRFVEARQSGDASVLDPYLVREGGRSAPTGSPWS